MEKTNNYLVAYDFSNAADSALKSAFELKRNSGGYIFILNVVKSISEIEAVEKKMELLKLKSPYFLFVRIEVGNLKNVIDNIIKKDKIDYVLFGTHGQKGIQKITGSNALKLVDKIDVPFLITQEGNNLKGLKNIILTYSYDKETVQINKFIEGLCKNNNAIIHLVGFDLNDNFLKAKKVANEIVMSKFLTEKNIHHKFIKLPGKSDYSVELLNFTKEIKADLIASAYFNGSKVSIFKNFVQELITNDLKIPVLTANAETMSKVYF